MKICIVTPDTIGPIRNGGIGTHVYNLCQLLEGHEITLLFTSDIEQGASQDWQLRYRRLGIRVLTRDALKNTDSFQQIAAWEDWFFERSRRIGEYLQSEHFDLVHFQDWHANGFHAIKLRKNGVALQNTRLVVTMHSPNEWSREGMQTWPTHALSDAKLAFAERYCCEHADTVLSPSQHMFDWAIARGWKLPKDSRVYPNPYLRKTEQEPTTDTGVDRSHLVFFGRLETRKGLGIFIAGLKLFLREPKNKRLIRKITFLGKPGLHNGRRAETLVDEFEKENPALEVVRHFDLDSQRAINYLLESKAVAFMPSLLDNLPFTVIECIERKIPFMASQTGGIPEMADPCCLFDATREGVASALETLVELDSQIVHRYSANEANRAWRQFHQEVPTLRLDDGERPKISICIPYYNHPTYLPQLLESISRLDYRDFEVIVCDDGSPSPEANAVFEAMRERYASEAWTFFAQENAGVGAARNAAAAKAIGDYIVFMDADNIARPEMLEIMVRAMRCSGADALTCYFTAFTTEHPPKTDSEACYLYRPLGAALPLGIFENTFGDANCILKRSVFETSGGFTTDRTASCEDWEFLLHLAYTGYELDVIPQEIFWYRHLEEGFSRITNHHANHMRAIHRVLERTPPAQRELIRDIALPMYYQFLELERTIGRERITQLSKKKAPWHKHIYRWYRRHLRKDPKYSRKS